MLFNLPTKKIENYRYEISFLKNKNLERKEREKVENSEKILNCYKYSSRIYLLSEFIYLGYKIFFLKKNNLKLFFLNLFFIYIRINIFWLGAGYTSINYLDKMNLEKIFFKFKSNSTEDSQIIEANQFKKFIEHKN